MVREKLRSVLLNVLTVIDKQFHIAQASIYSAADKLSYENNCAFGDKSMKFLPVLVNTIRFTLRCGGKSDLTSDALERSMTMPKK